MRELFCHIFFYDLHISIRAIRFSSTQILSNLLFLSQNNQLVVLFLPNMARVLTHINKIKKNKKTFALSMLWYQANFVVLNESVIKKIETMAYKFIWNSCELIKRDTLLLDYNEGGLKMISIRAKLKTITVNIHEEAQCVLENN